jgi:D-arabinose 1-dehydrogenase-like Zn-dependent alcohol dehydrogenase
LGLAAIQIAQAAGASVIGTAGSLHKRKHLRTACGVREAVSSRTTEFAESLGKMAVAGNMPDTVLNSLTSPGMCMLLLMLPTPCKSTFLPQHWVHVPPGLRIIALCIVLDRVCL